MSTNKYRLLCGPRANFFVEIEQYMAEFRLPAEHTKNWLQEISIDGTTAYVAHHRYIRHTLVWGGEETYVYAWEHATHAEILDALVMGSVSERDALLEALKKIDSVDYSEQFAAMDMKSIANDAIAKATGAAS